jgi:hypothetical protein
LILLRTSNFQLAYSLSFFLFLLPYNNSIRRLSFPWPFYFPLNFLQSYPPLWIITNILARAGEPTSNHRTKPLFPTATLPIRPKQGPILTHTQRSTLSLHPTTPPLRAPWCPQSSTENLPQILAASKTKSRVDSVSFSSICATPDVDPLKHQTSYTHTIAASNLPTYPRSPFFPLPPLYPIRNPHPLPLPSREKPLLGNSDTLQQNSVKLPCTKLAHARFAHSAWSFALPPVRALEYHGGFSHRAAVSAKSQQIKASCCTLPAAILLQQPLTSRLRQNSQYSRGASFYPAPPYTLRYTYRTTTALHATTTSPTI